MSLTHKELVEIAYKWVLKNTSCGIAFKELNSLARNGEYPDVIAFGSGTHSILIECKISRADFIADKKKHFRVCSELGMGSQRFYCCPAGLIKKEELPDGWGLVYVNEKGNAKTAHKPYNGNVGERVQVLKKNVEAEHELMYSALRRVFIKGFLTCIYDKNYSRLDVNAVIQKNET